MPALFENGHRHDTSSAPEDLPTMSLRIAADVKASLHSEGVVLIHHTRGIVFSANRVGAMIWKGAAENRGLDRVVESIATEFHVPAETAHRDAVEFLSQLRAEGLLVASASRL